VERPGCGSGRTLLVPYAIVGVGAGNVTDPAGWTTQFSITNVSSQAQIVHITVWSARSAAVVDWDVLLTGYDVWTIDFKDCLDGNFDKFDTGPGAFAGPSAGGYSFTPAAWGPVTNPTPVAYDLPVAGMWASPVPAAFGCAGVPPYGKLSAVGDMVRTKLRLGQAAAPAIDYWCDKDQVVDNNVTTLGKLTASDPFFFYVTADVVNICSKDFPNTNTYWGNRVNADRNVIVGDVLYLQKTIGYSEMLNAVHLESYGTPASVPAGLTTFYWLDLIDNRAALSNLYATRPGNTFADTREPLGTEYAVRYVTSPAPVQSNVIVWKNVNDIYDNGDELVVDGCRSYRYWAWNEDELTKSHGSGTVSGGDTILEPCALCFETQKVPVATNNFPGLVTIASGGANTGVRGGAGFGWMWLDFWSADKSTEEGTGINDYEAYVAVEFVFGNYATAAAAPLLWTPYNRTVNGSGAFLTTNTVIPVQNAYTKTSS